MTLEHVLLIRPGALGDAVLTLPVVAALRRAGANVTIVGTPSSWAFLPKNFAGVRVADFGSRDWLFLFSEDAAPAPLPKLQASLAIVYLATDGYAVAQRLQAFGVGQTRIYTPPLLNEPTPAHEPIHATERLLAPLREFLSPEALDVQPKAILELLEPSDPASKFDFRNKPYFVLHPGSGGLKKCWSAERYAALAERISNSGALPIVLFGPADDSVRARFDAALSNSTNIVRVVNEDLRTVLALLAGARGYAGNDSGVSHLAARVCPATVLFGPTDPAVWSPQGNDVRIVRASDARLDSIAVETVLETVLR